MQLPHKIKKIPHHPEYIDVLPSTYLVLAQDVLAETAQALSAVQTLYAVEKQLRKLNQKENNQLPYLEGVWKLLDPTIGFTDHLNIQGQFMLHQEYDADQEQLEQAKKTLAIEHANNPAFLNLLSCVAFKVQQDGPSIRLLHVGPYHEEASSFTRMEIFAQDQGWQKRGEYHREIYLKDSREVKPQDFQTLLYMYVKKTSVPK